MSYGEYRPSGEPVLQYHVAGYPPQQYNVKTGEFQQPADYLGATASTPISRYPMYARHIFDVGILRDTLAPSLALHSGLSVIAWAAGRHTNRLEAKDWLWPAGQLVNAWWSAVGRRVIVNGSSLELVWRTISWPETLLLTGVTAWGARLFYRIATRSIKRGKDDPRYDVVKQKDDFWNSALFNVFLPEALFQAVISLPYTAPFRHQGAVMSGYHPLLQSFAVGLFSVGFTLEVLADYQQAKHKKQEPGLQRNGVWSIVRHPNYLGDILMHASFPLLLFASDMLAPVEILGPLANYFFLRRVGGDYENETSQEERYAEQDPLKKTQLQEWKTTSNSIWPALDEKLIKNEWTWIVIGAGVAGALLERGVRSALHGY